MRSTTPEPRLPLEPEEYPLYRPPRRVGCSALAIVPLILIGVFALLIWRVTPNVAESIVSIPRQILNISTSTPSTDSSSIGTGGLATQTIPVTPTVAIPPTNTIPPVPPTATAVVEYFKVANTGGQGVRLRAEPQQDGARVTGLGDGVVVKTVGPDQKAAGVTWKHVATIDDQYTGWINSNFLVPTTKP
ncbi:MAG: SH3 domain-containing protein [Chloroflexota bacterium]